MKVSIGVCDGIGCSIHMTAMYGNYQTSPPSCWQIARLTKEQMLRQLVKQECNRAGGIETGKLRGSLFVSCLRWCWKQQDVICSCMAHCTLIQDGTVSVAYFAICNVIDRSEGTNIYAVNWWVVTMCNIMAWNPCHGWVYADHAN